MEIEYGFLIVGRQIRLNGVVIHVTLIQIHLNPTTYHC